MVGMSRFRSVGSACGWCIERVEIWRGGARYDAQCTRATLPRAFHSAPRPDASSVPHSTRHMSASSILVLHNVAKKKNFGDLIRSAAAMGVEEIIVVGAKNLATHGAQGCASHVKFSHFLNFKTACPYNEGQGLTPQQIEACEQFVYIPQHSDATASLNVNAACAVVLHHFAMWAALPEAPREGYKYLQGPSKQAIAHSGVGLKQMRTLNADGSVLEVTQLRDGAGAEEEAAADGVADGEDAAAEGGGGLFDAEEAAPAAEVR